MGSPLRIWPWILITLCALSCVQKRGADVELLLPDRFHGFIIFIEDPRSGQVVDPNAPVFFVPTNGVVRVSTLEPFRRWHIVSAQYLNGVVIPRGTYPDNSDSLEKKLYPVGGSPSKVFLFVGTASEVMAEASKVAKLDMQIQ